MNIFIGTGNLTADAVTRTVKFNGADTLVTDFTVAVNEQHAANPSPTEFVRCSMWRDTRLQPYLKKGRKVSIVGDIHAHPWTDNNGKARTQMTISDPRVYLEDGNPDKKQDEIPFVPDETIP